MEYLMISLLQINYRNCQWQNLENESSFDNVTNQEHSSFFFDSQHRTGLEMYHSF